MSKTKLALQKMHCEARSLRNQQMPTMAGLVDRYADLFELALNEEHKDIQAVTAAMRKAAAKCTSRGCRDLEQFADHIDTAIGTEALHA